ncbi:Mutator-like transposase domain-containing protein [Camponotus japonicus]
MDRKQNKASARRPCNPPKKRKFHGNRYSDEVGIGSSFASTSAEKLKSSKDDSFDVCCDDSVSYCFIQFFLVFSTLQNIVKCKQCNSDIKFSKYGQRGLGFKIKIECLCEDRFINSGNMINNAYEVNRRFVHVMRLLGVGLQGIHIFCELMDMGKGLHINAYYKIVQSILESVSAVYDLVTKKAVREEKDLNVQAGYPENEFSVSGDGSWSKRGFSSLLRIVSLTGKYSNKMLDTVVKSSFCRACNLEGKENSDGYDAWYENHEAICQANHEGSAGKMEVDGIIEMFRRSVEKYGVRYAYYIGDGDTKTLKSLLEATPYGDNFLVKKRECVLHVKKRLYRRAMEAKKQLTLKNKARKQQEGEDGKSKSKSRRKSTEPKTAALTNKLMQDLSLYYGLAIRRHPDSVEEMRKEIWATYYHKISTDENPQHQYCPEDADSWCKWRQHEATGTLASFSHPPALNADVAEVLKPIYEVIAR